MYQVLSPDGIPIGPEKHATELEAFFYLVMWCKRYLKQGYYSSPIHGRIPVDQITDYCSIVLEV